MSDHRHHFAAKCGAVYRTVVLAEHYDALRAEVEALRKDAERYRWLRDHGATCRWEEGDTEVRNHHGLLDEAVDESITKANGGEA